MRQVLGAGINKRKMDCPDKPGNDGVVRSITPFIVTTRLVRVVDLAGHKSVRKSPNHSPSEVYPSGRFCLPAHSVRSARTVWPFAPALRAPATAS